MNSFVLYDRNVLIYSFKLWSVCHKAEEHRKKLGKLSQLLLFVFWETASHPMFDDFAYATWNDKITKTEYVYTKAKTAEITGCW